MNSPMMMLYIVFLVSWFGGVLWYVNRCRHFWELVDKTEFPSIIEEYVKCGVGVESSSATAASIERLGIKRAVIVLRCSRCGNSKIEKIDSGP